ncbi:MAG: S8 family serine peptidase, partial [Gemmataceae bacterium]
ILFVAATDRDDVKTSYSNFGRGVDVSAPGGTQTDGLITTDTRSSYTAVFGTSMSAAVTSGTAALIWSQNPRYTRDQVAAALLGTADDLNTTNPNFAFQLGSGRVNAGAATNGASFVTRYDFLRGLPEEGQSAVGASAFTLRPHSPLNPSTVTLQQFELRGAGGDNTFNTSDDLLIDLSLNDGRAYKIGTNELDFRILTPLSQGLYKFTAFSGGLSDPFGRAVDGDGDGTSGGNLVRIFGIAHQVQGVVYEDTLNSGSPTSASTPLPGQTVFADLNNNGIFDITTFRSNLPSTAIPDADPDGVSMAVIVEGLTDLSCLESVSVLVSHPSPSDLTITLVSPDGDRVVLFRNRVIPKSDRGDDVLFIFQDNVPESSDISPSLSTHRLRPESPLQGLMGGTLNGVWRIEVTDTTPGGNGSLRKVSLAFGSEPCSITDFNGLFTLQNLPLGVPTNILVIAEEGWKQTSDGALPVIIENDKITTVPMLSFGLLREDAIYGRVLRDDGNGSVNPADMGLAGWTVYVDRNNNAMADAGEPHAITDSRGNYRFDDQGPGTRTVRVKNPGGFTPLTPANLSVTLNVINPTSTGNDFLLRRQTNPIRVQLDDVSPPIRNTPYEQLIIRPGEPLSAFSINSIRLQRDGVSVALPGATLIAEGSEYTLVGLGLATRPDGEYTLFVNPPAPIDQPGRVPEAVSIRWTMDSTGPTATLRLVETNGITGAQIQFSEPVTGLTVSNFTLERDGAQVPLVGVDVVGIGAVYTLRNLGALTRTPGNYILRLNSDPMVLDLSNNRFQTPVAAAFKVDSNLPPIPPPPTPRLGQRTLVGVGPGSAPLVNVYESSTGKQLFTLLAYEAGFTGGVRVATMDFNRDGIDDIVTAPGPGGSARIRVFDGKDGRELAGWLAFEESFTGGAFPATGDLTGDGISDLVITPDVGGGPRVRIYDGRNFDPIQDFFGINDVRFRGGARASIGDMNAD